jgi:Tol biopolymer transport system component/DNA-binding winged helix-turn-helix (wHTH) protein
MLGGDAPNGVRQFGAFELDSRTGDLRKHGVRIKLQDQPRQILLLLLDHPGEVVTRDQIRKQLWPDATFVDFDNAINSAMRKLRTALGDTAENPRFIETLARRGYRLVVPLSAGPGRITEPEPAPSRTTRKARGPKWQFIAASFVIVIFIAVFMAVAAKRVGTSGSGEKANIRVAPLTANPGLEMHPSFSQDGTRVAYVWHGPAAKGFSIYTKLIGAGEPMRISKDARDFSPAWSPDGRWVAALRDFGRETAVILIPSSGGQQRELARAEKASAGSDTCVSTDWPHICGLNYWGPLLTWSPDGKYLFSSAHAGRHSNHAIVRFSVDTGEQCPITSPPPEIEGDFGGAVSPDGRNLAFARLIGARTGDLYVATLSDATPPAIGQARRITFDGADVESPAWTRDGREVIFSSDRGGRRELWRVEVSGSGKPYRAAGMGENATDLAISPDGKRLAYSRMFYTGSLWKVPIGAAKAGRPERVTATTARDKYSQFSPDGKRIAFQSARSGVDEIWVCDADGGNPVQLTRFGRGMTGSPRWSPDGQAIAFDSNVEGSWDIYVIRASGGGVTRLTSSPANDAIPNWSRDGRWIYFASSRTGSQEIWKIRADGSSETQVTKNGGNFAAESVDGKSLYFKHGADGAEIWKMAVGGGPATKELPSVRGRVFTVAKNGIYFAAGGPVAELRYFDFETRSIRSIAPLSNFVYADVSSDEHWMLYPKAAELDANLMLVESFR